MQPAAQRFSRHVHSPARLDLQSQRRTAPPRATPPTRSGHGLEDDQHGALAGRCQDPQTYSAGVFLGWIFERERPRPVRFQYAIDAGARTKHYGGNLAGGASRRTQQPQVQGQQVALAGAAHLGHHPGLLRLGNIHYRRFGHSGSSLLNRCV